MEPQMTLSHHRLSSFLFNFAAYHINDITSYKLFLGTAKSPSAIGSCMVDFSAPACELLAVLQALIVARPLT